MSGRQYGPRRAAFAVRLDAATRARIERQAAAAGRIASEQARVLWLYALETMPADWQPADDTSE